MEPDPPQPADAADPPWARDANEAATERRTWNGQQPRCTPCGGSLMTATVPPFTSPPQRNYDSGEILGLCWSDIDLGPLVACVELPRTP